MKSYSAIIIGAGHAGIESALALARMGHETLLLTLDFNAIGFMACNPAIGGTAKGHLVREIDALGGQMGLAADEALLQIKMLNLGKGPAVHSLRGQEDKAVYQDVIKKVLFSESKLDVLEGECAEIIEENGKIKGVKLIDGNKYYAPVVILATGVYLDSRIIIGEYTAKEGPSGFDYAKKLTYSLKDIGMDIRRFKTGTPARIAKDSIDYNKTEIQLGDESIDKFSFMSEGHLYNQMPCYLTYTNARTHEIIRNNLSRAPLYNGSISGVGPRYCPSIEDKVMRFADKERHQIFIEPEGRNSDRMYIQGLSSSMPADVQEEMYHSVAGLENARFIKYAYAIEYDCINPLQLDLTMRVKHLEGLYTAGQINGSSGYEEAAAQGILAGINAARYLESKEPYIIGRDKAYIGVLADDLVTKGTNEPYRMMTARAEYRLALRQDNADLRLTADGYALGLATSERYEKYLKKKEHTERAIELAKNERISAKSGLWIKFKDLTPSIGSISVFDALKKPNIKFADIMEFSTAFDGLSPQALETAEVMIKYEGYLNKQQIEINEKKRLEERVIPDDVDYLSIKGLRIEARQKLDKIRPHTLAQAGRISGVSPADVTVLIVYLQQNKQNNNF